MNGTAEWFRNGAYLGYMNYMWYSREYINRNAKSLAMDDNADELRIRINGKTITYERRKSRWYKI